MARFRNNQQQIVVEPVYQHQGIRVERVQRFDQTVLLPETDHWRAWSFRITLGGTRYVRYGEQNYTLAPNTIFWHSPLKDVVRIRALPGTGSDVVTVTYSAQRWSQFLEQAPIFHERNAALLNRFPQQALLAMQMAPPQLLHVIRRFMVLSQAPSATLALGNSCALLMRMIGELYFDVPIQPHDHERRRRVEQAQARMVNCLESPPSVQQIAADLSVSPRQLQRDFLACTGLTPMRYLNIVRLSEANSLLAETSIPIAEIARLLGYVSLAHFSGAFRQMYSCSPREVRESNRASSLEY